MSREPVYVPPHHDSSERYVSDPCPLPGNSVEVVVDVGTEPIGRSWLRTVRDGEQEWVEGKEDGGRLRFELPCHNNAVNYRFHLETPSGPRWLNGLGLIDYDPGDVHDFRLVTTGRPPSWVGDGVWYQIFPDRFATTGKYRFGDQDGRTEADGHDVSWVNWSEWSDPVADGPAAMPQLYGGDLDGVIQHMDHIAGLGVKGIYLNPVFPARSNHRYDASTFDRVDPLLGGDEALVRLSKAAHDRGLKIMTDLTLNHTGDGHEWFKAAQADPDSDEADFYYFTEHPDQYESWLGVSSLPKLDHGSEELRRRYYKGPESVLGRYLRGPFNMDGWRIDVANMTGRLGSIDMNHDVARQTRLTMDDIDPDLWLLGEHFFDASLDAPGDGWHGVMNYAGITRPVVSWLGDFTALSAFNAGPGQPNRNGIQMARAMDVVRASMPWSVTTASMGLLASHDTARWRSMAVSDDLALVGFGLLLCLPGTPTFLYGDEIGLTGETSEKARCTMPWDESRWDKRFVDCYRNMIGLRNSEKALQRGGFRWVSIAADDVCFMRETSDDRLLVRASRAATSATTIGLTGTDRLEPVLNADGVDVREGAALLPGDGPTLSIWRLS